MKNYLISVGGTGAKCLEAFVHMNAMGLLKNPGDVKIIYVDPDASNGNLDKAKNAVAAYVNAFRGAAQQETFFKNGLTPEKTTWNPVPTGSATNLRSIFDRANMDVKEPGLDFLFDTLFSEEEQNTLLTEGFRAHPAIGAAVIGANMNLDEDGSVWQKMVNDIGEQEARIFFFGSVFGGTGAAGFPNIAKIIRKYFDDKAANNNPDRTDIKKDGKIKMGGCLMLPYFTFPKATEKDMFDADGQRIIVPDSGKFFASTYAALNYYNTSNLVGDVFDAVYLLGDKQLVSMDKYKPGRAEQKNKAHFIEMFAALAACEFFNKNAKDSYFDEANCYMTALLGDKLTWDDFPPVADGSKITAKIKTFIRMAYMFRSQVFPKLKECYEDKTNTKFKDNPWIEGYLHDMQTVKKFGFISSEKDVAFISDDNYYILQAFDQYCINFMDWLKDFTYSEFSAPLRGDCLVNPDIFNYDDNRSLEDNLRSMDVNRVVSPENIFVDKTNTTFDGGENNFLQQMTNSNADADGVKPLIAKVYDICKDGKEVE